MSTTWFTADRHFGHANIIRYYSRPFASIEEMDETIVQNWNALVRPEDNVWHVGDFSMRGKMDSGRLRWLFDRLQGIEHLVVGNHDGPAVLALPWATQTQIAEVRVGPERVVCCHYPMRTWPGVGRGAIHVFGHEHGRLKGTSRSLDVGVDCWGFAPVCLPDIRRRLRTLPVDPDVEPRGDQ